MIQCPICGEQNLQGASQCRQCGAFLLSLYLPVGTKLGRGAYTVGKMLGQGSFGITYMGTDILSRPIVIKELFPEGCIRDGNTVQFISGFYFMKQQFLEEARLLASLNHPGIIRIYDFFKENNTAYMVMEFVEGKNLLDLLVERGGVMEEREAIDYITQVAEALEAIHKAGYLHRNIKPQNIMVTNDGRSVLMDSSGCCAPYTRCLTCGAEIMEEMDACPDCGTEVGMEPILTPGYAPLEQYARRARFGPPLDIYALGATLYHLLTGQVPPPAPDRAHGIDLLPPHQLNPKVSRSVSEAVMKAMAIVVYERPQTVRAFIEALRGETG